MVIKFDKEQIAALLKNESVQKGMDKASKSINLPEMNTTTDVLEYIGSCFLGYLADNA